MLSTQRKHVVAPADAANSPAPCYRFTNTLLVTGLGRRPKPRYISATEHLFPFRKGREGATGAPTRSYYISLSCHTAWQFILGSARWHLRHRADKALRVTSMRPVGAVTTPLAMKWDKMDNMALNISTKQEKQASAARTLFSSRAMQQDGSGEYGG